MKQFLHTIGWIDHRGKADKFEIAVDIAVIMSAAFIGSLLYMIMKG